MKVTVHSLAKQAAAGEKIAMLTCYDASFAQLMDEAGVDMLLVGDSLGMVIQGQNSTLPVSLDDMLYHTRLVARGAQRAMVVADLPFGAYQQSPQQAFAASAALMAAGAQMVKLEGGAYMAPTVAFFFSPPASWVKMTLIGVVFFGAISDRADEATAKVETALRADLAAAGDEDALRHFLQMERLVGGNREIMAGRGSFIESFPLFGYNLEDQRPEAFPPKECTPPPVTTVPGTNPPTVTTAPPCNCPTTTTTAPPCNCPTTTTTAPPTTTTVVVTTTTDVCVRDEHGKCVPPPTVAPSSETTAPATTTRVTPYRRPLLC